VVLAKGTYYFVLNFTNAGGVSAYSNQTTFSVCDLSTFYPFITSVTPANYSLSIAGSIANLKWAYNQSQPSVNIIINIRNFNHLKIKKINPHKFF